MRISVVGHVEHITIGRVASLPKEGEIAHVASPRSFPGGGGGVAFLQLTKSASEILLFTALGNDDAARLVEETIAKTGARIFSARRDLPHTRDVVMVTPKGERTIVVVGEPLHPTIEDPLPWDELARCDAAYFTAQDPKLIAECRRAKILVVSARRRPALVESKVQADVVVGSAHDPREESTLADYPIPPRALVMTEGEKGGVVYTRDGAQRFSTTPVEAIGGAYGAGDSFAGALTHHLALGLDPFDAAHASTKYGAAVLSSLVPLDVQMTLPARWTP